MKEIWKDIEGYEGYYQVSNLGRVRSLSRRVWHPINKCYRDLPSLIKANIKEKKNGYYVTSLCKDGKQSRFFVHRLVAKAFLPNPNNLPQVNHKNEIKQDNNVENLEWCDCKYNCNYGTCRERIIAPQRRKVSKYTKDGKFIETYPSFAYLEKYYGYNHSAIIDSCNNENHTAYGYKWKYSNV